MEVGWRFTSATVVNGGQSVMIPGALLMLLSLVDKWVLWVSLSAIVLDLALEHLLRTSCWMMWHAEGQSHGLLTAIMMVIQQTVSTVKM